MVIDDEPLAIKLLSNYVDKHDQLTLNGSFLDPIQALHDIDTLEVDLIFLDVQMPQLSGIQFLKILNNRIPVILTTAYDQYALESYDFKVIDYLLKPINFERFSTAIRKFHDYNIAKPINQREVTTNFENTTSIFIKSGHRAVRIALNEILFLESKGDYLYIITKEEQIKTLENLKDIIHRLTVNFLKCHRSFIVNMDCVDYIENSRIVIENNYIPISRAYIDEVQQYINEQK